MNQTGRLVTRKSGEEECGWTSLKGTQCENTLPYEYSPHRAPMEVETLNNEENKVAHFVDIT